MDSSDTIYISRDAVLGAGDDAPATVRRNGALAAGGSYNVSREITLPLHITGSAIHIFVRTDVHSQVHESDDDNNSTSASPFEIVWCDPDLIFLDAWAGQGVPVGRAINVGWWIRNAAGPTDFTEWHDHVHLSSDRWFDGQDVLIGDFARSGWLSYMQSYSHNEQNVPIPDGLSGRYYVIVATDAPGAGAIGERNENNNVRTIYPSLTLGEWHQSDLVVATVDAPAQAYSGQTMTIGWTVRNQGAGPTNTGNWIDVAYLSRDQYLDRKTDVYLGHLNHGGALEAGAEYAAPATRDVLIPYGLTGPYYVFVATDSRNAVAETNDGNNHAYDGIAVQVVLPPPADLVVANIAVPPGGILGEPVTVQWTVRNDGSFEAQGSWHDSVYLSGDTSWDLSDKKIGKVRHTGPLASGAEYTESLTATLPGVAPGSYHIIVRTDIHNEIREGGTGEANNITPSSAVMDVDCWELALGVPDGSHQLATGTEHYYKILNVPPGEDMLVTLDCAGNLAVTELFIRYGDAPDRVRYDFAYAEPLAADHEIMVPSTRAGAYYVLLRAEYVLTSGASYTISANLQRFSINNIDPTVAGTAGDITVEVTGARFTEDCVVHLETDNGQIVTTASMVLYDGSTRLYATFDLHAVQPGRYYVAVEQTNYILEPTGPGPDAGIDVIPVAETARCPVPLEVAAGGGSDFFLDVLSPSTARVNRIFAVTLRYGNRGVNDMEPPLVVVTADQDVFMSLPEDTQRYPAPVQFLALGSRGPVSKLRPGDTAYVTYTTLAPSPGLVRFEAFVAAEEGDVTFDGYLSGYGFQPGTDIYSRLFDGLIATFGGSWGSYRHGLLSVAESVAANGEKVRSAAALLSISLGAALVATQPPSAELALASVQRTGNGGCGSSPDPCDMVNPPDMPSCDPTILASQQATLYGVASAMVAFGRFGYVASSNLYHFLNGSGSSRSWDSDSALSRHIRESSAFDGIRMLLTQQAKASIEAEISCSDGTLPGRDLPKPRNLSFYGKNIGLEYGFGGTQDSTARLSPVTVRTIRNGECCTAFYSATVTYETCDNYCFDLKDESLSGFDRMARDVQLCGWAIPYTTRITISFQINGRVDLGPAGSECDPPPPPPPPPGPPGPGGSGNTNVLQSVDPNEKSGPAGLGERRFVGPNGDLLFTVNFENLPDATAPAQEVTITDQLSINLDWRTFRLGEIAFGDTVVEVPGRRARYVGEVTIDNGLIVRIQAGIDIATGAVTWQLTAIDPATGEIPDNALLGMLPPNNPEAHDGEGHVTFTIRARPDIATGAEITNEARIVFDINEPLDTNQVFNTVDPEPPDSAVDPLPARQYDLNIPLTWSGNDSSSGSGLRDFAIYVSVDDGPFAPWISNTTDTAATYVGEMRHTYAFYSRARDNVGNMENAPTTPDATVEIPGPEIGAAPTSFSLQCQEGGSVMDTPLAVWNRTSMGTLDYQVATTPTWLGCLATTGSSTGVATTHTVLVDPTGLNEGDYAGTLTVVAAGASNSPVAIPVLLSVANSVPTATIDAVTSNPAQPPDGAVNFVGTAGDAAGSITAWQWRSSVEGILSNAENFTRSSNDLTVGEHLITFTAWDDEGTSSSDATTLTVLNALPTATIVSMVPNPVAVGATVTVRLDGQDNDGQGQRLVDGELTWPDGVHTGMLPGTYVLTAQQTQANYSIRYRVRDEEGTWSPDATEVLRVLQPSIAATPTSLTISCVERRISTATLTVWNSGLGTLAYTAAADPTALLSIAPPGAYSTGPSDPTTHTVTFDASALVPGDYAGTITLVDPNAFNTPVEVPASRTAYACFPTSSRRAWMVMLAS